MVRLIDLEERHTMAAVHGNPVLLDTQLGEDLLEKPCRSAPGSVLEPNETLPIGTEIGV